MSNHSIAIVDSGSSNVIGVSNVVRQLGHNCIIAKSPKDLVSAQKMIIPGVGAFDAAISALKHSNMFEAIRAFANSGKPVLGICLGMQLLLEGSAEGTQSGLGLIPGYVDHIRREAGLRIPHIGWNHIEVTKTNPIVSTNSSLRFYFNHSFAAYNSPAEFWFLQVNYGGIFAAGLKKGNILGVQFHPEKSHTQGRDLIKNFLFFNSD